MGHGGTLYDQLNKPVQRLLLSNDPIQHDFRYKKDPYTPNAALPVFIKRPKKIDRFHNAWCEENNLSKTNDRATEVASGLVDWYVLSSAHEAG
jgi:hypothetical protein